MPFLLLHGALGTKKQFSQLKASLKNDFEVYDMNFEGHGDFVSDKDFSIPLFTENVIQFLDENKIDSIDIFGYSLGGYVALNTALHFPDRVNKIVTLGTKVKWDIESAEKEVRLLNPDKIEEKVPQFAAKLKEEHHPQDWKNVMRKTATMMLGLANGKKLNDDEFQKINHSITIGIGELDNMVTYAECENLSHLLPNSRLKMLEGLHHPIDKVDSTKLAEFIKVSLR